MEEINPLKNPIEYQTEILRLMRAYESLIGELYVVYGKKFPEQIDFWKKISKEEDLHAYWIETLTNQIGGSKVYFNEGRFSIAPLKECIDEIGIMIATANKEEISLLEAISCSVSIENGMIEKSFFETFESDSAEIKKTFSMLKMATMQHGRSVKEMWDAERSRTVSVEQGFFAKIKKFFQ